MCACKKQQCGEQAICIVVGVDAAFRENLLLIFNNPRISKIAPPLPPPPRSSPASWSDYDGGAVVVVGFAKVSG